MCACLSGSLLFSVLHENIGDNVQEEQKTTHTSRAVQINIIKKFRSKVTQTVNMTVDRMTSPVKCSLKSRTTSPIKITQCTSIPRPSTSASYIPSRFQVEELSTSSICKTPSVSSISASSYSPSTASFKQSSSDCSEFRREDEKRVSHQILQQTISKITRNPRAYIGVPKNCYNIIQLIEETTNISASNILMCFKKIRLNNPFRELADDFSISPTYASKMFLKNIPVLASVMRPFIVDLNETAIKRNLPMAFRHKYNKVSCIIDCLEIEIQKPSNSIHQALSWSEYKKANTIKYLVSCTPNGLVNFISPGYGGRITDTCLVETCNFNKCLKPGMWIMADRGFKHVETYLLNDGVRLVRPPSVGKGTKLSKSEARETKQIASLRIHVERVIRRLREFNMLKPHACLNHNLVKVLDDVITIACGLINLQNSLIK